MFRTKRDITGICITFTSHIKIGPAWFLACCDVSKQLIRDSSFLLGLLFKKTKHEVRGGRSKACSSAASQQHISEVPPFGIFQILSTSEKRDKCQLTLERFAIICQQKDLCYISAQLICTYTNSLSAYL